MATLAEQLTEAQTQYAAAVAAELSALADGQEVRLTSPGGVDRTVVTDLNAIRRSVTYWRTRVALLTAQVQGRATFAGMTYSSANFGD